MEQYTITMTLMISTTAGGDSKYLFPGEFRHQTTWAFKQDANDAIYDWMRVDSHGDRIYGKHTLFANQLVGSNISVVNGNDVQGSIHKWTTSDGATPDKPYGTVEFFKSNGQPAYIQFSSFSGATATGILTELEKHTPVQFKLYGNKGNDTLRGSNFADTLDGGHGKDLLIGGKGNDHYLIDNRGDRISDSGGKSDTVESKISYRLGAQIENLMGDGLKNINLTGNDKGNWIYGNNGKNVIQGLGGNDKLVGGLSHDTLTGGAGSDRFYFTEAQWSGDSDTITDFTRGSDKIWLFASGFDVGFSFTKENEKLNADAFHASKTGKAHDLDDRILYNTKTGNLYYDEDGTGSGGRIQIATLSHHPNLHASDLMVFIV